MQFLFVSMSIGILLISASLAYRLIVTARPSQPTREVLGSLDALRRQQRQSPIVDRANRLQDMKFAVPAVVTSSSPVDNARRLRIPPRRSEAIDDREQGPKKGRSSQ